MYDFPSSAEHKYILKNVDNQITLTPISYWLLKFMYSFQYAPLDSHIMLGYFPPIPRRLLQAPLFIEIQSWYCSGEQGPGLRTKKWFTVGVSVPFEPTDGLSETCVIGDEH